MVRRFLYCFILIFCLSFSFCFAGTDPAYENYGYLLTSGDMLQILEDIHKTDDVTYTTQEIINMTYYYNTWATAYKNSNQSFTTNDVIFCNGKVNNSLTNKDIAFIISQNLDLTNEPNIILISGNLITSSDTNKYLATTEPLTISGTEPRLQIDSSRYLSYYKLSTTNSVEKITPTSVNDLDIVYVSPVTLELDNGIYYVDIKTVTTTKYSLETNLNKYEILYKFKNTGSPIQYCVYAYLTNHTNLSGSGESVTPTPTPTPTPTQSGDSSGDNGSGDFSPYPTPINYNGRFDNIDNSLNNISGELNNINESVGNLNNDLTNVPSVTDFDSITSGDIIAAATSNWQPPIDPYDDFWTFFRDGLYDSLTSSGDSIRINFLGKSYIINSSDWSINYPPIFKGFLITVDIAFILWSIIKMIHFIVIELQSGGVIGLAQYLYSDDLSDLF